MEQLLPLNFAVGEPTNEASISLGGGRHLPCRVPNRDYSGADAEIQFPEGYHVKAGLGSPLTGAYHQDVQNFEPYRVRVASHKTDASFPLNHLDVAGNLVRMIGGEPDKPDGSAMLTRDFAPVKWSDGRVLVAGMRVLPTFDNGTFLYFNFELRGKLSFVPVQEGSLGIGVGLRTSVEVDVTRGQVITHWWRDGVDGQNHDVTQRELATHLRLTTQDWYQVRIIAAPTVNLNEWAFKVEVRGRDTKFKYDFVPANLPNNVEYINAVALGDEMEHIGNGGRWYLSQVNIRATQTDEEAAGWRKRMKPKAV